ncbi:MarR family winged helix-turn-helix transcriptional regulator [Catellatospora vulcania]|uniref:MarR family winged helix-turn-helix transcriptional regulator n=1 Tax=Catellatospora vulcania TaxID=1460450 RepID=UPI0012D41F7D|nr:MarR family winged helix-turn-helix transcriptional regulator [Catellatospora vulcania]
MSVQGPGQLLFGFVRHWSRRAAEDATAEQGRIVLVTEAVNSLVERDEPATVNAVAHELGIDQSGASRLIRSAADAGCLTMAKGASDGRRREVSITAAGHEALAHAHAWQEKVFGELTAGWSRRQRDDFQRAMADLITRSYGIGP